MKTINLAAPWTYRTVAVTIDYRAGAHEVAEAVHAAAVLAGVHTEEEDHGDRIAAPRAPRRAGKAQG